MLEQLQKDKYLTLFSKAVESSIYAVGMTDLEGILIYVNEAAAKLWGYHNKNEMLGRFLPEFWGGEQINKTFEDLHCKGYSQGEDIGTRKDGSQFDVEYSATIIRDDFGEPLAMFGSFFDITERRTAQRELKKRQKELEDINATLRVLLKKREEDKIELENRVLSNVDALIEPYLEKFQDSRLNDRQKDYLKIIRTNIKDIISPFAQNLSSNYYRLTPQEIQIASHIKRGKTTKEIAAIMNLSPKTIEAHRTNIRKKLGLKTSKTNLKTQLMFFK